MTAQLDWQANYDAAPFALTLQVRDYECDFQGIVNHAVYLHYLEHARHEFAKQRGLNVVALAQQGLNLVIIRAELDYKAPLRNGDEFSVSVWAERYSRARLRFHQQITRAPAGQLCMQAQLTVAAMNARGRPCWSDQLECIFATASPERDSQPTRPAAATAAPPPKQHE